jgi:hypothetical protein
MSVKMIYVEISNTHIFTVVQFIRPLKFVYICKAYFKYDDNSPLLHFKLLCLQKLKEQNKCRLYFPNRMRTNDSLSL